MAAILHLGNAKFKGTGDEDAEFASNGAMETASKLLGCDTKQVTAALCTLNIKAGVEWIQKANTTRYAQSSKDVRQSTPVSSMLTLTLTQALSKVLYSRLFDAYPNPNPGPFQGSLLPSLRC